MNPTSNSPPSADASTEYVRFIIVSAARTGSNMLAQSLNSRLPIRCFGEVFNFKLDFVMYNVEGYDNYSAQDLALQQRDPLRFLQERIFCEYPESIRAVGFKYHYGQFWGYRGLLEHLVEDTPLRVLHLRRRNILRTLVSLKLAQSTGVFLEGRPISTRANLWRTARHPLRAATRLPRHLRPPKLAWKPRREAPHVRVTITKDELFKFIITENLTAAHYDDRLGAHPKLTLFYEDLLTQREKVFNRAQSFLGVEPAPLAVTLRRQNPEPLRELLANYDELYEAYRNTRHAWMFD